MQKSGRIIINVGYFNEVMRDLFLFYFIQR